MYEDYTNQSSNKKSILNTKTLVILIGVVLALAIVAVVILTSSSGGRGLSGLGSDLSGTYAPRDFYVPTIKFSGRNNFSVSYAGEVMSGTYTLDREYTGGNGYLIIMNYVEYTNGSTGYMTGWVSDDKQTLNIYDVGVFVRK